MLRNAASGRTKWIRGKPGCFTRHAHAAYSRNASVTPPSPVAFAYSPPSRTNATSSLADALSAIQQESDAPPLIYALPPRHPTRHPHAGPSFTITSGEQYLHFRELNRSFSLRLSPDAWMEILDMTERGSLELARREIISDAVECVVHQPETYSRIITHLLNSTLRDELTSNQIIELFHAFPPATDIAQHISVEAVATILDAISTESHVGLYVPFVEASYGKLVKDTTKNPMIPPNGSEASHVWTLLRLIDCMLRSHPPNESLAIKIFSTLSSANRIPSAVLQWLQKSLSEGNGNEKRKLAYLLDGVSVMCCFAWGWHEKGLMLLNPYIGGSDRFDRLEKHPSMKGFRVAAGLTGKAAVPNAVDTQFSCLDPNLTRQHYDSLSQLITILIRNLLQFPSTRDTNAAASILIAFFDISKTLQPNKPPLPIDLLHHYFVTSFTCQPIRVLAKIYLRCFNFYSPGSNLVPSHVATRIMRLHGGSGDVAKTLIADILTHDKLLQNSSTPRSDPEICPEFVIQVAKWGGVGEVQEVWLRAMEHWDGYPRVAICGNPVIMKLIVDRCIELHSQGLLVKNSWRIGGATPGTKEVANPLVFARLVVEEFAKIRLKFVRRNRGPLCQAYDACVDVLRLHDLTSHNDNL